MPTSKLLLMTLGLCSIGVALPHLVARCLMNRDLFDYSDFAPQPLCVKRNDLPADQTPTLTTGVFQYTGFSFLDGITVSPPLAQNGKLLATTPLLGPTSFTNADPLKLFAIEDLDFQCRAFVYDKSQANPQDVCNKVAEPIPCKLTVTCTAEDGKTKVSTATYTAQDASSNMLRKIDLSSQSPDDVPNLMSCKLKAEVPSSFSFILFIQKFLVLFLRIDLNKSTQGVALLIDNVLQSCSA